MLSLNVRFFIFVYLSLVHSKLIAEKNDTEKFNYFQLKYDRHYKNEEDRNRGFKNFVRTMNKVSDLNEKYINDTTMYVLNKYADEDPDSVDDRYGIKLTPYDNVRDPQKAIRSQSETELGHENTNFVDNTKLYDLNQAEELYEQYMKKYNKKNATKKGERKARYYRFVKTLVEINQNNMRADKKQMTLDDKADEIKDPNAYFF